MDIFLGLMQNKPEINNKEAKYIQAFEIKQTLMQTGLL